MRNALDWKFYDNQNEDHRAHRDPRPLENLEEVISPEPDEDGNIQSHPLPPHHPRLTELDRQIFESCAVSGPKILWPHVNGNSIPRHLTIQYIMKKANCSAEQAREIADEAALLDATPTMVDEFCRWARVKGAGNLIDYLYPMALTVVEVEDSEQEEPGWFYEPTVAGKKLPGIQGEAGICEDIETDINPDYLDFSWEPVEKSEGTPATIGYHVLEDFNSEEGVPWIDRQPKEFQALVGKIQRSKNLDQLGELGRDIYESKTWNHAQTSVLWTEYSSRKSYLERQIPLTCTTRSLIDKIANADGHLGSVGIYLHKVQAGEIKVFPKPADREWTIIWRRYQEQKEALAGEGCTTYGLGQEAHA